MKHYCRSAACEHRVMITDSINHCQPQLILSYLFLFCSIQVSRNVWQPSSLGRAKDQTVLLFIDSKAPPAQPQSLLVPAAGASSSLWSSWDALGSFLEPCRGNFLIAGPGKLRRTHWVPKVHRNSAGKRWSENPQVSNPKSGQDN